MQAGALRLFEGRSRPKDRGGEGIQKTCPRPFEALGSADRCSRRRDATLSYQDIRCGEPQSPWAHAGRLGSAPASGTWEGQTSLPFVLSRWLSIPADIVSPNAGIRLASPATPDTLGPMGGVPRRTVARKPWSLEPKPHGSSHTSRLIPRRSRSISRRSRTRRLRIRGTKRTPSRMTCSAFRSVPRRDRSPLSFSHPFSPGRARSMPIMILLYLNTIAALCKPCQL